MNQLPNYRVISALCIASIVPLFCSYSSFASVPVSTAVPDSKNIEPPTYPLRPSKYVEEQLIKAVLLARQWKESDAAELGALSNYLAVSGQRHRLKEVLSTLYPSGFGGCGTFANNMARLKLAVSHRLRHEGQEEIADCLLSMGSYACNSAEETRDYSSTRHFTPYWSTDKTRKEISGTASQLKSQLANQGKKLIVELRLQDSVEDLEFLAAFPNIEAVSVSGYSLDRAFTAKELSQITNIPNLRELYVGTKKAEGLASIAHAKQLELLSLGNNALNAEDLIAISKLNSLRSFGYSGKVTDGLTQSLSMLPIVKLSLHGPISDQHFRLISQLSLLNELNLSGTSINAKSLQSLSKLRNLRELSFYDSPITTRDFAPLTKLSCLESLRFSPTAMPPQLVASLSRLPKLHELQCGLPGSEASLRLLSTFPALQSLGLDCSTLCKNKLKLLGLFRKLRNLELCNTYVDDEVIGEIAKISDLEWLQLRGCHITDAGAQKLDSLTALQKLYISDIAISDNGLKTLGNLPQLKQIYLDNTQIQGTAFEKGFDALEDLTIRKSRVNNTGLVAIGRLKNLKAFRAPESEISTPGVFNLSKLSSLETLNLYDTRLDIDSVPPLLKLKRLTALDVRLTDIPYRGLKTLEDSNPLCTISPSAKYLDGGVF